MQSVLEEQFKRAFDLEIRADEKNDRLVEMSVSSEEPYERYLGKEILVHNEKAIRMERFKTGAPFLLGHDPDNQVAVIKEAWLDGKKLRVKVLFSKSAGDILEDVKEGIRTKVSIGYRVHKYEMNEDEKSYRVTDWEPYEASLVSIPADNTVGVGRKVEVKELKNMSKNDGAGVLEPPTKIEAINEEPKRDFMQEERNRVKGINDLARQFGDSDSALKFIGEGKTLDEYKDHCLTMLKTRKLEQVRQPVGLNQEEIKQFSFLKLLRAKVDPSNRRYQEEARFELEACEAASDKLRSSGRTPKGLVIPTDITFTGQRDLTVGTAGNGGYTVATDLLSASFIDLLRAKMVVRMAGATILSGLNGAVAIPRGTAGTTTGWVAESNAASESTPTFDQVALAPKTISSWSDISRKLLLQSSIDVEAYVRGLLAADIAQAIDLAALHGTGSSNQPTGIAATSGIGSVAGGTNGAAPDFDDLVNLETEVSIDNADIGSLAYITNTKVRGKLKRTIDDSGSGIRTWDIRTPQTPLNGYMAHVTNQVSSTLTKGTSSGVCSAIFFGNWVDLIIGEWGALDILVDIYTGGISGTVRVSALQDVDVAVRHPQSFAAMLDALTT